ncbi:hypothetical protein D3C71_1361510 [compost metagenome]
MRNVQNGLRQTLEPVDIQFIEHDGEDQRGRKGNQQIQKVQHQRIAQCFEELLIVKYFTESVQADPLAAGNALEEVEILECNLHAVHRAVFEDEEINQRKQQHGIQTPVSFVVNARSHGGRLLLERSLRADCHIRRRQPRRT